MKSLFIAAALLAAVLPAQAQTNVSINVGQPGFYGRIDIGNYAPPPVVYVERPVVIERHARYDAQPVYLRVPPGHRKNWERNCARYNACGQRVLFVRDEWYTNSYAPSYREHYRDRDGDGGERRDYGDDRDDDRGHGGKHGRGHDKDDGHGHGHGKHGD